MGDCSRCSRALRVAGCIAACVYGLAANECGPTTGPTVYRTPEPPAVAVNVEWIEAIPVIPSGIPSNTERAAWEHGDLERYHGDKITYI